MIHMTKKSTMCSLSMGLISLVMVGCTGLSMASFKGRSKHFYDRLILAHMDMYNEAVRYYVAGNYDAATTAFSRSLSYSPGFHLNDKAAWYLGECYTQRDISDSARTVFLNALEQFTTSPMRPRYLYGLMCLDLKEGN